MDTIYINEKNCKLHRAGEHILVKKEGRKLMTAPLAGVTSVVVNTSVQFTTQILDLFLEKQIDVIFMNLSGKIKGHLFAQKRNSVIVRLAQYSAFMESGRRLEIAKKFVCGKVANQREVLKKYKWDAEKSAAPAIKELGNMLTAVKQAESIEELMGFEGISAKLYFDAARFMLKRNDFTRREYRPAGDIVNSALNLGYAFLANETAMSLRAVKLDEELGFLHSIHYGRNSLALDLMEEFRAPFIDSWVFKMFNLRILNDPDFEGSGKAFYLNRDGYRKFCHEYEQHEAEYSGWRRKIMEQAKKLRRAIVDGEEYEPFRYE